MFTWSVCPVDSLGKRNPGSTPQGDEWEGKVIQLFNKLTHRPNSTTPGFPDTFESVSIRSPIALGSNMGSESDYPSQSGRQFLCSPSCQLDKLTYSPTLPVPGGDERFWTANENSANGSPLHRISYLV